MKYGFFTGAANHNPFFIYMFIYIIYTQALFQSTDKNWRKKNIKLILFLTFLLANVCFGVHMLILGENFDIGYYAIHVVPLFMLVFTYWAGSDYGDIHLFGKKKEKRNMKKIFSVLLLLSINVWAARDDLNQERVHVKSWKSLRDENIVKQDLDYSCGAASLATLLNRYHQGNYTEAMILQHIGMEQLSASFADMKRVAETLGFQAEAYALSFEQLKHLKTPVIVYLRHRKNDHFSVLYGIEDDVVLLADLGLGHLSLSRAQFLKAWQHHQSGGKVLAVVSPQQEPLFKQAKRQSHIFWQNKHHERL